jgi:hypothetical protein
VKLVAATTAVALSLLVAAIAASCSINHRSSEFTECMRQADCSNGQSCIEGICQNPNNNNDAGTDADVRPDALVCPSQCTSCRVDRLECRVDCSVSPATCNIKITCPEGWNCTVLCSGQNSCRSGIDCTAGKSCNIECSGTQSCRDIECGAGPCTTACTGSQSCRNVDCNDSCKCDVTCANAASCEGLTCSEPFCSVGGRGCSSSLVPACTTPCP